jgi:hypothetical protein
MELPVHSAPFHVIKYSSCKRRQAVTVFLTAASSHIVLLVLVPFNNLDSLKLEAEENFTQGDAEGLIEKELDGR